VIRREGSSQRMISVPPRSTWHTVALLQEVELACVEVEGALQVRHQECGTRIPHEIDAPLCSDSVRTLPRAQHLDRTNPERSPIFQSRSKRPLSVSAGLHANCVRAARRLRMPMRGPLSRWRVYRRSRMLPPFRPPGTRVQCPSWVALRAYPS